MGEVLQMKAKVFLDTNILLDLFVPQRKSEAAVLILTAVKQNKIEAFVTTQSLLDAHYISHKSGVEYSDYVRLIKELRQYVNIGEIDILNFDFAIDHHTGDVEDDAQYACAYDACCDYFITRDKDLLAHNSDLNPMTVVSPEDFLEAMQAD